jgi:hypothetical protein
MRNTVVWSFLSLVALASGGLITGCDSDATIAKSGVGESCDSSADCNDGLKCIEGACYKSATGTGGSENQGGEGTGATGTGATGPTPPVLGGEGESCTKAADCEDGLGCFNQRCSETGGGEGGQGSGPKLGGSGETCGLTSDCSEGLACLPQGEAITAKAIGSNSVGVCTPIDSGIEATGKTCGHECVEAADCCELPIPQQVATGAASCTELALLAADVPDCDVATGANGRICLAYSVYCDEQCGKNTWACEAGQCQYTAKCTKLGEVIGGCPLYTRGANVANIAACNMDTTKCEPEAQEVEGCKKDADCVDQAPYDYLASDTCVADECACQAETGRCYRKCAEDLDCPLDYVCDTDTNGCIPEGACTTDAFCVVSFGDIRAKCGDDGVCAVPCENDIDCNPGGLVNGYFSRVCSEEKTCVSVGCSSNDECGALPNGVKSFCDTPAEGESGPGAIVSAITD